MKAIIAGGTGMVGQLVLNHCLDAAKITEVVSLVREPTGRNHSKLKEIVLQNFADYSANEALFQNIKTAFFCLGAYTGQVPDSLFKKITVDYAVAFAKALEAESPRARFCLLSGTGADRTEKSHTAFAKYKGMAENQIAALKLEFYTFRPAYIFPVTPRQEPNLMYKIARSLYPLLKLFGESATIKSTELAKAMFKVGLEGTDKEILENKDILKIHHNLNKMRFGRLFAN